MELALFFCITNNATTSKIFRLKEAQGIMFMVKFTEKKYLYLSRMNEIHFFS